MALDQPTTYAFSVGYFHGRTLYNPRCPWEHSYLVEPYNEGFEKGALDRRSFDERYKIENMDILKKGKRK